MTLQKKMEMVQDGRHIQDGGQTSLISSIIVATKKIRLTKQIEWSKYCSEDSWKHSLQIQDGYCPPF